MRKPPNCCTTICQKRSVVLPKRIVRTGNQLRQHQGRSWRIDHSCTEYISSESASVWSEAILGQWGAFTCIQKSHRYVANFPILIQNRLKRCQDSEATHIYIYSKDFKVQLRPRIQYPSKSFAGRIARQVSSSDICRTSKRSLTPLAASSSIICWLP